MAKDAYYFSHDTNARNDPKILMLRAEYGMEGLGFYWCLLEIMAEQADYKINVNDSKKIKAFALHLNSKPEFLLKLIDDCVSEFELFKDEKGLIYSESLLRRMAIKDAIREKRSKAGRKGGKAKGKQNNDEQANAKQEESKDEANEKQVSSNEKEKKNKVKRKRKEIEKKNPEPPPENFEPSEATINAYRKLGYTDTDGMRMIETCLDWHRSKGNTMIDWQAACRTWINKNGEYKPPSGSFDINQYGRHAQ